MADGGVAGQALDHRAAAEGVADQADRAMAVEHLAVEADDAGRLLAAMLQGVQAQGGVGRGVRVAEHGEDAAFLLGLVVVAGHPGIGIEQGIGPQGCGETSFSSACRCSSV